MNLTDGQAAAQRRTAAMVIAAAVSVAAAVVTLALDPGLDSSQVFANGAFVAVGALIVLRRPGNVVGPLLVAFGLAFQLLQATYVVADRASEGGHDLVAGWLAIVAGAAFPISAWLLTPVTLYFPNGRSPSRWVRWLLVGSAVYASLVSLVYVFARPDLTGGFGTAIDHPFLGASTAESFRNAADALSLGIVLFQLMAIASIFVKWRGGDAIERRQIGWFGMAVVTYGIVIFVNAVLQGNGVIGPDVFLLIDAIGVIVIPVAIGIAIMRYRLYEIDVIVSKSVTYLGLAASITLLYIAVVVGPLLLIGFPDSGGPGLLLPIVAAAVVAFAFEPIRLRMQRWANRLVYGNRASPYEVLSNVTSSLADTTAGDGTDDLARLLARGTGAERAVVWLRRGDVLRPAGVYPTDEPEAIESVLIDGLVDDEHNESRTVHHRDEQIGALTITKPRNDQITPADRELLTDVAAGAGLLLRNISLNRQLEQRALEVRASRQRLIAAQDAERHRLERDLHDGAQQQVVALKVKLGIAKTIAEREGADEIATRVVALADETQHAVDALRAVAHGIYPPLLESEGLETALRAIERTSPIPLTVDVAGQHRYARFVEETIYFCVLETLERTRMAGATDVRVTITEPTGELVMNVDAAGPINDVDLTAISDRFDAAHGNLTIQRLTDTRTRIAGSLPTMAAVLETA